MIYEQRYTMGRITYILLSLLMISACSEDTPKAEPIPKFEEGDIVKFRAFDVKGMVIGDICHHKWYNPCVYTVRVHSTETQTDVSLLGEDGASATRPVAVVESVREYEIEKLHKD